MFKTYCDAKAKLVEARLDALLAGENSVEAPLGEAMRYSLLAGGKRLRPILLLAAADAVGARGEAYLDAACALELVHTYSLIHDDLPAMDDDDYRRGKLTNHKVYGDGMAILAGDALLTLAFEVLARQQGVSPEALLAAVRELSRAAGPYGMVAGQALDLESEGRRIGYEVLRRMHAAKTGALFRAALRMGAILAGAPAEKLAALTAYAEAFGLAFQITDDILDVTGTAEKIGKPVGSDARNDKSTYVSLLSLATARVTAQKAVDGAVAALAAFGSEADVLREGVRYLIARDH